MCGIVAACLISEPVLGCLIEGLESLEYRGYDSAGVALSAPGTPRRRERGRVEDLKERIAEDPLPEARAGIAHTRWATHGAPSRPNAHPHRQGPITLVHNGILENHDELREVLAEHGAVFESETDTEVWAALLAFEERKTGSGVKVEAFLEALAAAMGRARGSYALAILHENHPGRVFFARNESPLVLGMGEGGRYLASDVAALLKRTHEFLYLEEGDLGWITAEDHLVVDRDLKARDLRPERVSWDPEAVEKGGYAHFMLKEIEEQAGVLARTLQSAAGAEGDFLPDFRLSDEKLRNIRRVVMIACGTALHAARVGKYLCEEGAGIPAEADYASEFRYRDPMIGPEDLVLAISQSGETADTLGALKVAISKGAVPAAICNVPGSSLCRAVEASILTKCGPEIGVASTKAFTGQLLALHLLTLRLAQARNALPEKEIERRLEILRGGHPAMQTLLSAGAREHVAEVAKKYARKPIFFFLGRGPDYPIALEGALKLKEISYVHAEGYPSGEMKHGPLALVSEDMVVVALAGETGNYAKVLGNLQEVKSRGGHLVVVTTTSRREAIELADDAILVPRTDPLIAPMLHVIPLQYMAYYVALERGCDIDKPRNLAKSVTVE